MEKKDILYVKVDDVENTNKIDEFYKKGRLISEYVGFQVEKDKIGVLVDHFSSKRKYVNCKMAKYTTLIVGGEVFDEGEYLKDVVVSLKQNAEI